VHRSLLLALLHRPAPAEARARIEASTLAHEQVVARHIATVSPQHVPEKAVLDHLFGPDLLQKQLARMGLLAAAAAAAPQQAATQPAAAAASPVRRLLHQQAGAAAAQQQAGAQQPQPHTWLDICLDLKMGGRWCLWHSDWVVAECIHLAAGVVPDVSGGTVAGLSYNSCRPDTLQSYTTCHHVPAAHYRALYAHMLAQDDALRAFVERSSNTLVLNG
jgi:hypothetical protein